MYESVKYIQEEINDSLKIKATDYLSSLYNSYTHTVNLSEQDREEPPHEYFNIYIKLNNEIVTHRIFPAWIYPGKIRYTVDIRPFIGKFLRELSDVLSAEKVERKYLETVL